TTGISFIGGLGTVEDIQWPDAIAAALALVAAALSARVLLTAGRPAIPGSSTLAIAALVAAAATLGGLNAAGSHSHEDGHGGESVAGAAHDHGAGGGRRSGRPGGDPPLHRHPRSLSHDRPRLPVQ